jgi:hypothetical protein
MKSSYHEEKILIWGKTYPELSKRYIETVCTAGVLESGKPVRIYPITYRYLNDEQGQFKLYQWISAGIQKNSQDGRPESHKIDCESIHLGEVIPPTQDEWGKRAEFMFRDNNWQFQSVEELQDAQRRERTSIGVVTPKKISKIELVGRSQDDARSFEQKFEDLKRTVEAERAQIQMFEDAIPPEMKKLEFLRSRVVVSWFCNGRDCNGHNMQVLDWGLCELQRREGDEAALRRMKELCTRDNYALKFFLGNLFQYPASFLIVGMWYPKRSDGMFRW